MSPTKIRSYLVVLSIVCVFLAFPQEGKGTPAYAGYNFYGSESTCYLKDMNNNTIHTWTSAYSLASHAYLLRDSSVLFPCIDNVDAGSGRWTGLIALPGGRFQIIKWDGTVAWDFPYHGAKYMPHHDCSPHYYTNDIKEMPSIFAVVSTKEADYTIGEKIVEIKPTGHTTGIIKWEWRAFDHKVENGANMPELLDINKGGSRDSGGGGEWLHANHVRYNPMLDQVLVSLKSFNEIILIDHSTTTAQAATHSGGKYGKGGDILYRWGNPANYGCPGAKQLLGQHGACWVPNFMPGTRKPLPGAGDILVISNLNRKVVEITLPCTTGVYSWNPDTAYAPAAPTWELSVPDMGGNEGSLQRLPNGNTLVCNGISSTGTAEFDAKGKTVWTMMGTAAEFFRYDSSYLGSTYLDTGEAPRHGTLRFTLPENMHEAPVRFLTNHDRVHIFFKGELFSGAEVSIFSMAGRNVLRKNMSGKEFVWRCGNNPSGMYLFRVTIHGLTIAQRVAVFTNNPTLGPRPGPMDY
jgi:hypothetical protein